MGILKTSLPVLLVLSALLPTARSQTASATSSAIPGVASDGASGIRVVGQVSAPSFSQTIPGDFSTSFSQPNLWLSGGMTKATIEAMEGGYPANSGIPVTEGHTCGMQIPTGATTGQTNCFAAYMRPLQPRYAVGPGPAPVGFYANIRTAVNNSDMWGLNPNMADTDIDGTVKTGTKEYGLEIDSNVASNTTTGFGIYLNGVFAAQPADLGAVRVSHVGANGWTYGLMIDDGSVPGGDGITLGAMALAANSPSLMIYLNSRNSSNVEQAVSIQGMPDASVHVNAPGGFFAPRYFEALATPASSSAPCTAGQFTDDANYHYVCVATNTWKRVALSAF